MLFDQGTPDTSVYMIAGYTIFLVVSLIYLASLLLRARNLNRDLDTLEDLEHEKQPPVVAAPAPPSPSKAKTGRAQPAAKPNQARKRPAKKAARKR